jgi:V/A-type H+-transporting ATPase subunit G/H
MGGLGLIKSLAEKEKELLARLEAAKKEAEELLKRAEAEARALLEEAEAKAKALEAQYCEKEAQETEAILARYRAQAEAEAKAVREKAGPRLEEALALVLKEVLP